MSLLNLTAKIGVLPDSTIMADVAARLRVMGRQLGVGALVLCFLAPQCRFLHTQRFGITRVGKTVSYVPGLLLLLFAVGFFLPVFAPGRQSSQRLGAFGIQVLLLIVGLAMGWAVIGPMWWDSSGGCAAHGGNFEGGCGFAGVADNAIAAFLTAGGLVTLSGAAMFCKAVLAKRRNS